MAAQSTYSLALDGSGYVSTALSAGGLSAMTVSLWFKVTDASVTQTLISQWDELNSRTFALTILGGVLRFESSGDGNFDGGNVATGSTSLANGTWYHVAAVYGTTQNLIYLNGASEASVTRSSNGLFSGSTHVDLGHSPRWGGAERWLTGSLDDMAIVGSILTPTQIANIAGTPGVAGSSSLDVGTLSTVALWRAEAGTGTTLTDTSGNSHDGTFSGGVTWSALDSVPLPLQAAVGGGGIIPLACYYNLLLRA